MFWISVTSFKEIEAKKAMKWTEMREWSKGEKREEEEKENEKEEEEE